MRLRVALFAACAVRAVLCSAQTTPLSREDAVRTALQRSAKLAVARADTAVSSAQIVAARAIPNPSLSASYSKSVPNYHYVVDAPIDFPWIRQLRIRAAETGRESALLRFQLARALVSLDADTTYTRAVAARERVVLSTRTARDADSLLHMVERRNAAGDASAMDVELARIVAAHEANVVSADSLLLVSALLDLQAVLGMKSDQLEVAVGDSLGMPPSAPVPGTTLAERAGTFAVEAAALSTRVQRRSIWSLPTISFGFEKGDPDVPGFLPTFGVGLAVPLFDRNKGGISQAEAEHARAVAELSLTQVEARNQIARANRARELALVRVTRQRQIIASAERVAAMSLTAYREGASTLASVIESQRAAREVLAEYVDDLANAWIATAELRVLALPPTPQPPT